MIPECKKQVIELPDRKEISLCDAVTAVIFGKAVSVEHYQRREAERISKIESESLLGIFDQQTPTNERIPAREKTPANERIAPKEHLLEALRKAAYAGDLKFRAIKDYGNLADGPQDINRFYFRYRPSFNWPQDEISYLEDESPTVWSCVHLECEQFASLLTSMGYSVRQNPTVERRTGFASRPPTMNHPAIKQFVLERARNRLDAGDYPKTQEEFSEQLAKEVEKAFPKGPVPKPKTIRNNPEFRDLWIKRPK
ncbi:MAG: hypothetical protein ACLQU2_00855 [Candidatus Binataceae bacterium]